MIFHRCKTSVDDDYFSDCVRRSRGQTDLPNIDIGSVAEERSDERQIVLCSGHSLWGCRVKVLNGDVGLAAEDQQDWDYHLKL